MRPPLQHQHQQPCHQARQDTAQLRGDPEEGDVGGRGGAGAHGPHPTLLTTDQPGGKLHYLVSSVVIESYLATCYQTIKLQNKNNNNNNNNNNITLE